MIFQRFQALEIRIDQAIEDVGVAPYAPLLRTLGGNGAQRDQEGQQDPQGPQGLPPGQAGPSSSCSMVKA
jgi:hypothetical protein